MGNVLGKTVYLLLLVVANFARRIEKLPGKPKELVNQKNDINEWKREQFFQNFSDKLVLTMDATKIKTIKTEVFKKQVQVVTKLVITVPS